MRTASLCCIVLLGGLLAAHPASAQESTSSATPAAGSAELVTTAPHQGSPQAWLERDLEHANTRVRRTRNALIGTSVGLAVGIILAAAAASQCEVFTNVQGVDDVRCTDAGNALIATGGAIGGLSIIGMITSGAMLGVAKRNRRELEREIRRGYYGRRLRWDVPKGALVF